MKKNDEYFIAEPQISKRLIDENKKNINNILQTYYRYFEGNPISKYTVLDLINSELETAEMKYLFEWQVELLNILKNNLLRHRW